MGAGGEAEDENAGPGITKARDGTSPVGLILVRATLGFADAAAVVAKTRTAFTGGDGFVNLLKDSRGTVGRCHCIP